MEAHQESKETACEHRESKQDVEDRDSTETDNVVVFSNPANSHQRTSNYIMPGDILSLSLIEVKEKEPNKKTRQYSLGREERGSGGRNWELKSQIILFTSNTLMINPQFSPWKIISDRNNQYTIDRDNEQNMYKRKLQLKYQSDLEQQLKLQEQIKRQNQNQAKNHDSHLMQEAINRQRRIIEAEKAQNDVWKEKTTQLDLENELFENKKKEQQQMIKKIENQIELEGVNMGRVISEREKEARMRAKEDMFRSYQEELEERRQHRVAERNYELQLERNKLKEQVDRDHREDQKRYQFLEHLKERAAKVDYGSHQQIEHERNKKLVDKKREEWNNYQNSIELEQRAQDIERAAQGRRRSLENTYRIQLKQQLENKEKERSLMKRYEVEVDHDLQKRSANYSESLQLEAQRHKKDKKRELSEFLQNQMESRQKIKYQPYLMKEREYQMNVKVLTGAENPVDYFGLDPQRKKQLQIVERAMGSSPTGSPPSSPHRNSNYFAEKGKTIVY